MLLRVGIVMMVCSMVALTAAVAFVALSDDGPAEAETAAPASVAATVPIEPAPEEPEFEATEPPPVEEEEPEVLPAAEEGWPRPSSGEVAAAEEPRYYGPRQEAVLTLTIEALEIYGVPVMDSDSEAALDKGVIHIPQTPMPRDQRQQKNVYLAGHRIGYPGSGSHLVFYKLDELTDGDVITLRDRSGATYKYRVTETFTVDPSEDWVMDSVRDRDIVTLQTCTPIPTFEKRLIVRADRVES